MLTVPFTYPEVGATREAPLPGGYRHVLRDIEVGAGRDAFDRATEALLTFRMHRVAGLTVGTRAPAVPGLPVSIRVGAGPLRLTAPCRVVYRIDQPDRQGFAYGTLDGHPECGEEAFVLHLTGAGRIRFRITAFSRPVSTLARLGGPLTTLAQEIATERYLRSMRRLTHA